MRTLIFEIPDEQDELIRWLEGHLCGLELPQLIGELQTVHGRTAEPTTLDQLLGENLKQVLASGLSSLSADQLQGLLRQPELLADLQEAVLLRGGRHWEQYLRTGAHREGAARMRERVAGQLTAGEPLAEVVRPVEQVRRRKSSGMRQLLAAAALVLVSVGGWWIYQGMQPRAWGWNEAGVFTSQLKGPEYLEHLATTANEWFAQPRGSQAELEKRLNEFRGACDRLLAAEHPQLAAEHREFIKERCRVWKGKFDGHLADLSKGEPLEKVREEADGTVRTLMKVLRERKGVVS